MRWIGAAAASELQDARYGIRGLLAIVLLGQLRQVRWLCFHGRRRGAVPGSVDSVTRCAVLREHLFTGRRTYLLDYDLLYFWFLFGGSLRETKACGRKRCAEHDHALFQHKFLP
jgi:hypothetical protein